MSLLLGAVQLACAEDDEDACVDGRMLVLDAQGGQVLAACGSDSVDGGDYGEGSTYAGPDEDSSIYPTGEPWPEPESSSSTHDPSTSSSEGSTGTSTGCAIDDGTEGCTASGSSDSGSSDSGSSDSGSSDSGSSDSGSSDGGPA